jgi:hypothetical protein
VAHRNTIRSRKPKSIALQSGRRKTLTGSARVRTRCRGAREICSQKPLRRTHECVFGILGTGKRASGSEAIGDVRLGGNLQEFESLPWFLKNGIPGNLLPPAPPGRGTYRKPDFAGT